MTKKDKNTAGILALFLGGLGVHKFYMGHIGTGFIYLIFCWTFIPAIVALIDAISIFMATEEKFDQKINKQYLAQQAEQDTESNARQLVDLYELKEKGGITANEYEIAKSKLL